MRVNANAVLHVRSWTLLAAFGGSYAPDIIYMYIYIYIHVCPIPILQKPLSFLILKGESNDMGMPHICVNSGQWYTRNTRSTFSHTVS